MKVFHKKCYQGLLIPVVFGICLGFSSGKVTAQLTKNPITPKLELSQTTKMSDDGYLGKKLQISEEKRLLIINLEDLLEPFRNRPGVQMWVGEHIGKFLHAAVLSYQNSGNEKLKGRIDYAAKELMKCQLPDGYLGTYLEKDRWTSWDVWSFKYNLIGLLAYYDLTKDSQALVTCENMVNLLAATFGEGKRDIIASGTHVGMAPTSVLEPVVKLYTITGKDEYLQFCNYILKAWEQNNGPKLISSLLQTGNVSKTANGKSYEMMSDLVGLLDLYKVTGKEDYFTAVENAWNDIVTNRLYINGTTSHSEHFQGDHDLNPEGYYEYSSKFSGPGEGCVSVTWLQLNKRLLEITGEDKYMQQIENTIYNAILPSQNPNNGEVCYFLPLNGRKRYGEVTHGILPDVCCCSSSIPRGVGLIPELTFGRLSDDPIIMLLTAAKFETSFSENGKETPVIIEIKTDFPVSGNATVAVTSSAGSLPEASLLFNVPRWADEFTVKINDEVYSGKSGTILSVDRKWKSGDVLNVSVGMPIKIVHDNNKNSKLIALQRGPQLLATDVNVTSIKAVPNWGWNGSNQLYKVSVKNENKAEDLLLVPFADAGETMADYKVLFPGFEIIQTSDLTK